MEIEGRGPTAAELALDSLRTAFGHLVKVVDDGALGDLDGDGFVAFLQDFEQACHQRALVDHRLVQEAEARGLAETIAQPNLVAALSSILLVSRAEAARRVRAAGALAERVSMTGEPLPPLRPALAAAQRAGGASAEQVDVCLRAIAKVDQRGFDRADVDAADELLAGFTATLEPSRLRLAAEQVVERIDPDGTLDREQVESGRRHLAFRRLRDGMWGVEGRLTAAVGAKLTAVLGPLARPRVDHLADDGAPVGDEPDQRPYGQRVHDALEEVCDRLLRSGTLPDSGGTPATVVVTIDAEALRSRRGSGVTSDGTRLSAAAVVGLADEADVYLAEVDASGVVLDLGRTRRVASCGQTVALAARDGGCSFPGCDRPPEWCERHHVVAWADGGRTDLGNLTLLCAYHHHHFAGRGWTCLMLDGLPYWRPPRWIDREQRPQLNARVAVRRPSLLRSETQRC